MSDTKNLPLVGGDGLPPVPVPESVPVRLLDARALKALAHPLRQEILEALRSGPATSTGLAERLGQNTGTLSWHLRHLAENGFIEEDEGRGTRRERWWRIIPASNVLDTRQFRNDPAVRGVMDAYLESVTRQAFERVMDFLADDSEPDEWVGASATSDWQSSARLTPHQLRELTNELSAVVARHLDAASPDPGPDARRVSIQIQAFPRRDDAESGAEGQGTH